ncbi:MAG: hypothetical protein JWM44_1975 [Bacilli bacterium]|nr:hypothetical protein [Bacilli bacterium]
MKKRRVKSKHNLSPADFKILKQMREAADGGYFVNHVNRLMETTMSADIPVYRRSNSVEKLKLIVIRQLAIMANVVAAEKGIDISFTPVHPSIIFDPEVKR